MKKRIILADYYGVCDENGKAIGHSPKVIKEYSDLLKENYSVSAAVSPCIAAEIDIADYEDIYNLRQIIKKFQREFLINIKFFIIYIKYLSMEKKRIFSFIELISFLCYIYYL